jgi:hypothetical protein
MRMKALSPNNMIGRHLTTQNRVEPPKMLKKDKEYHMMKAMHNAKGKQARPFFLKSAKHVLQELSSISIE